MYILYFGGRQFFIFLAALRIVAPLVLLSVLSRFRFKVSIVYFGQFITLFLLCRFYSLSTFSWVKSCFFSVIMLLFSAGFYYFQIKKKMKIEKIFLFLFIVSVFISNLMSLFFNNEELGVFSSIFRPINFFMVLALPLFQRYLSEGSDDLFKNYLLFPYTIYSPLTIDLKKWSGIVRDDLKVKGFFDIVLALLFFIFARECYELTEDLYYSNFFFNMLIRGLLIYLFYYFYSVSWYTLPLGLARIMGYDLPSTCSFPLLASSPQERWRRWNRYFYHFFRTVVFIPIYKKTSSLFLAVMGCFAFMGISHADNADVPFNFMYFNNSGIVLGGWLRFSLAHGLLVYLGIKTQYYWPKMEKQSGWIGVVLTWFLMIFTHFLNDAIF